MKPVKEVTQKVVVGYQVFEEYFENLGIRPIIVRWIALADGEGLCHTLLKDGIWCPREEEVFEDLYPFNTWEEAEEYILTHF